jgi:tripartite-type tricarboxylate transporter receptor subunit TctC
MVLGGHAEVFCGNVSEMQPQVSSGEKRLLAIMKSQR